MIGPNDLKGFQDLEESLWRSETRFDAAYIDSVLAPDFIEFGRSGRIYTRAEVIQAPYTEIRCKLPLGNFAIHPLAHDVVMTTYISEVLYEEWEFANRSSIWLRNVAGWQLRFHQGTPIQKIK